MRVRLRVRRAGFARSRPAWNAPVVLAALTACLGLLALLVDVGALSPVDQFCVDPLMPVLRRHPQTGSSL
jgi:hypothetical protein